MPRKSKVLLGIVLVAIAVVALTAVPAFAASPFDVSLGITRTSGAYGQEFVITPSVPGTETIVGDTYTIQALQPDGSWANFGEGLKVDETGTVVPQYVSIDESFLPWFSGGTWHPTQFQVIYKTKRSSDTTTALVSYTTTSAVTPAFTVTRYSKVKWVPSIPRNVKRNRAFRIAGFATPDAGIGNVVVSITRSRFKTQTYKIQTDDSGYASFSKKLGARGTYTIHMHWLGNAFGPGSKTTSTKVTVK